MAGKQFPYQNNFFDAIISIQVIHHAKLAKIKKIISEIERVIKPNGFIFITVPKHKNQAKEYKKIAPNTYIPLDGWEKGLHHYYFTPEKLREVFRNFKIESIKTDKTGHYALSGIKK